MHTTIQGLQSTGGVYANGDGVDDAITTLDTDADVVSDFLKLDSDDDGIPDTVDAPNSGIDTDGDGIVDRLDSDYLGDGFSSILAGGEPVFLAVLPDSDSDNTPDFLQANEPAAAIDDIAEGFVRTGLAGRGGCTIAPIGSEGPLDPSLAILAASALMGYVCGIDGEQKSVSERRDR